MDALTRAISGRRAGMTLEEIVVYGLYALLMAPAVGLALYGLYLAIEEEGEQE